MLHQAIREYLDARAREFSLILPERKKSLQELSHYIESKLQARQPAQLVFICTHNSRRSHISQLWAQAVADYAGVKGVEAYSGGTEATAFHPNALHTMQKAGFHISTEKEGSNPLYRVTYSSDMPPLRVFSKKYDAAENPKSSFAAIMSCSHADENCPLIPGADIRLPIRYQDPKAFDGSSEEAFQYEERSRQIARELCYAFSQLKQTFKGADNAL